MNFNKLYRTHPLSTMMSDPQPAKESRKRKPAPVDPDNAEVARLQRNAERKQARLAQAAKTAAPSSTENNEAPKTKARTRQPSIEVIEDEDNIRASRKEKAKGVRHIIESSDDSDSHGEEDVVETVESEEVVEAPAESAEVELSN